ncbi:60S ribosomal protein L9-like [Zingiber officinale]|uniref:60S ribosomal protein L9-like n=1 Tax=Zingiber officinale TaxID=94328 RepID=UPI001C4C6BD1|nr:60S ribosomal protein L9-like [Zingiber officinale]
MKTILSSQTMDIPEGVTVKVNAKIVEVEGPRGKLTRDFKHLNLDFELIEGGKKLKVDAWFGSQKTTPAIRTSLIHIDNLITGVTKGYRYKMRLVYAHFPINASITPNNSCIEIRNFLGEKKVRQYDALKFVEILVTKRLLKSIMISLCFLKGWKNSFTILFQDLKPHNLLMDRKTMMLKVADLGLSRAFTIPLKKYTHEATYLLACIGKHSI